MIDKKDSYGYEWHLEFNHMPDFPIRSRLCQWEHATNTTPLGILQRMAGYMSSTVGLSSDLCGLVCEHVRREIEPKQMAGMAD